MLSTTGAAGSGLHGVSLASWQLTDLTDIGAYMPRLTLFNVVIYLRHGFLEVSVWYDQ